MQTTAPQLLDIDDVKPFSEEDQPCFDELRAVLVKHGRASRFGITLLHQHFDLADDEVLLERSDAATRTQTIRPAKIATSESHIATNWRLDVPGVAARCSQYCQVSEDRDTGTRSHDAMHQP